MILGQEQRHQPRRAPSKTPWKEHERSIQGREQRAGSVYNQNCSSSETHSMAGGGQNPDNKSLGEVGKYNNNL